MVTATKVVTSERFAKGLTWQQYVAEIKTNKEQFEKNYHEFKVSKEDADFFSYFVKRKGGEVHVLALGEDWCPDVVRGLPIMARIAEAGGMDMKVFPRDTNMDLMEPYLWRRQHQSIPTFVFFDKEFNELGTWVERPSIAYKFMAELTSELEAKNLSEEDLRAESRRRRQEAQELWKQETVREIRELLYRVM